MSDQRRTSSPFATHFAAFIAGAGSGAAAAIVTSPLDVVKIRAQAGGQAGTLPAVKALYRSEGIRGLYRGLAPTLTALAPNWAIFFPTYQYMQKTVLADLSEYPHLRYSLASMGAGAVTSVCMNPIWTIRTRLVTQPHGANQLYTGIFQAFGRILREEGVHGLFKGLGPSLLGLIHVAVQFPLYESAKKWFAQRRGVSSQDLTLTEILLSSASSKIAASVAAYPHEVLRTRLQDQRNTKDEANPNRRYRGLGETTRQIFRTDGIKGFYRGMTTNLPRVTVSCAITFTSYEMLMRLMNQMLQI